MVQKDRMAIDALQRADSKVVFPIGITRHLLGLRYLVASGSNIMVYASQYDVMKFMRKWFRSFMRLIALGLCGLGIWYSWKFAHAGFLSDQDTEASVRAAIVEVPDAWPYYLRLAQFDQVNARPLLSRALELNRYDAQAYVELALQYETEGSYTQAENLLLSGYAIDRTYLPRWSLANFYLRRDNLPEFWRWARSAAAMPSDDISPLFDLCWRVAPDPQKISTLLNGNPQTLRQFIEFLLAKDQVNQAGQLSTRLIQTGDEISDRPMLLSIINRLIATNDKATALALWHALIERRWVDADLTEPNNARFSRQPLPVSFDWTLPEETGLHSWPGESGLEIELSGEEPEDATLAEQVLPVDPGSYTLAYSYRTTGVAPDTGIHWQIIDAQSGRVLGESADLSSEKTVQSAFQTSVPPDMPFVRLRLHYHRALGTPRIAGRLVIEWVRIEAHRE